MTHATACHISTLLIKSYCALHRKDSLCTLVRRFCVSRKGGTGGGEWGHLQDAVHMAAELRKRYSHHSGSSFLAGKPSLALSRCLPIESADHCMLVNEWAWLTSRVCLLRLEVLESELGQKWRYGVLCIS